MVFEIRSVRSVCALLAFVSLASACTYKPAKSKDDEFVIGDPVEKVSALATLDGQQKKKIAIYDKTVRVIHQFDLTTGQHLRGFPVLNPDVENQVLYSEDGGYVVNLSKKHLTVFDRNGGVEHDPISFQGLPMSAAFRPNQNLLIVYDNLFSVGILRLTEEGKIARKWVGGPFLSDKLSVQAGDVTEDGRFVLALNDDSITIVDVDQTISDGQWRYSTPFATGLNTISWVAPVRGSPSLVMVKSKDSIALVDIDAKAVVGTPIALSGSIIRLAKSYDPHVVIGTGSAIKLINVVSGALNERKLTRPGYPTISSSKLDQSGGTWTYIEEGNGFRSLRRVRFSDMYVLKERQLPANAVMELASDCVFALFPAELGQAIKYSTVDDSQIEFRGFNLDYIH